MQDTKENINGGLQSGMQLNMSGIMRTKNHEDSLRK